MMVGYLSKLVQCILFQLFCGTPSISHPVSKAQYRVSVFSCQEPFAVLQGYQHQVHLPAMIEAFPLGNLPLTHLQSLSLLLTDRTDLIGILCHRRWKRNMSRFSPSLHCCSTSRFTHCMDPGGHPKGAHGDICLSVPITLQIWKGVLLMGITMSYFNSSLKFS